MSKASAAEKVRGGAEERERKTLAVCEGAFGGPRHDGDRERTEEEEAPLYTCEPSVALRGLSQVRGDSGADGTVTFWVL